MKYKMMSAAIQVISYLNEIINLIQLWSWSSSWKAWNIRRLAIRDSFVYLKFPPNLLFKSRSHLRTVKNNNVFFFNSLTYLVSYSLYKFISRKQRTKFTSHYFYFLEKYQLFQIQLVHLERRSLYILLEHLQPQLGVKC